jgi:hypothetical protein
VYGSNDDQIFAREVCKGTTLWIVASLPKNRPPELIARLAVEKMTSWNDIDLGLECDIRRHFCRWDWIARCGEDSEFFGHNNAGKALLELMFGKKSAPWILSPQGKRWLGRYGSKLQGPTLVAPEGSKCQRRTSRGIEPLKELSCSADRSVFLSWKWVDEADEEMVEFAYALADLGFMPWLDLLALPRAKALNRVQKEADKLERLLKYGYRRSRAVIAVGTNNYGEISPNSLRNWTLGEWENEIAPEQNPLRVVYPRTCVPACCEETRADKVLAEFEPKKAAAEFAQWWNSEERLKADAHRRL